MCHIESAVQPVTSDTVLRRTQVKHQTSAHYLAPFQLTVMGRKKIAPYFMFLLMRKEELRAQGRFFSDNSLSKLVSEEWSRMTAEQKATYKGLAEVENGKMRFARNGGISSQQEIVSAAQQMASQVAKFLAVEVGTPRADVMKFEFISGCISPVFTDVHQSQTEQLDVDHEPRGVSPSTQEPSQVEICLVRWRIVLGVKEVYHVVYSISKVPEGAFTIPKAHTTEPMHGRICSDLDVIAAEIHEFMGDTNGVLVRGPHKDHVSACLNDLFNYNNSVVRATPVILDNVVVLRQLILNEKQDQGVIPHYKELGKKLDQHSGAGAVRFDYELNCNTGVDCWHSNQQYCAARRAVNDVVVLLEELGPVFQAQMFEGYHWPIPGKIMRRRPHRCGQLIKPKSAAFQEDLKETASAGCSQESSSEHLHSEQIREGSPTILADNSAHIENGAVDPEETLQCGGCDSVASERITPEDICMGIVPLSLGVRSEKSHAELNGRNALSEFSPIMAPACDATCKLPLEVSDSIRHKLIKVPQLMGPPALTSIATTTNAQPTTSKTVTAIAGVDMREMSTCKSLFWPRERLAFMPRHETQPGQATRTIVDLYQHSSIETLTYTRTFLKENTDNDRRDKVPAQRAARGRVMCAQ